MEGEAADKLRSDARVRRERVAAARSPKAGFGGVRFGGLSHATDRQTAGRFSSRAASEAGIDLSPGMRQDPAALRLGVRLLNHAKASECRITLLCGDYILISDPGAGPGATFSAVRRRRPGEALLLPRESEERPTLALDTVGPYDRYADVVERVAEHFDSGAARVWLLDPAHRSVSIHVPGYPVRTLEGRDELTCEPWLPGFTQPVALLFSS